MGRSKIVQWIQIAFLISIVIMMTACTAGFQAAQIAGINSQASISTPAPIPTPAPTPTPSPSSSSGSIVNSPFVPANYTLTFDDEFKTLSDISTGAIAYTPGIKWYNGIEQCCMSTADANNNSTSNEFGTGMYPTPSNGVIVDPYSLDPNGGLDITLSLNGNDWNSGVMQTVGKDMNGFSQQYGYFEMEASLPVGVGTWPAFWMLPANSSAGAGEIDIMEAYGVNPNGYCATLHDWSNTANTTQDCMSNLTNLEIGYHIYGMLWTATDMYFYLDGQLKWQTPTLAVMNTPYYILVDLGIGGGWPTNETPTTNVMNVKYVRAYQAP